MRFIPHRRLPCVLTVHWCSLAFVEEMYWSLPWAWGTSLAVCRHRCSEAVCMAWNWIVFQEGLQSSFIRMPISVLRVLKRPISRITSLMSWWVMCHSVTIRCLIRSITSTTSESMIILLRRHWIRSDREESLRSLPRRERLIKAILPSASISQNGQN